MSIRINVLASTVPAICIVLGFLLMIIGSSSGNPELQNSGWIFVILGALLQVFYLMTRSRRRF